MSGPNRHQTTLEAARQLLNRTWDARVTLHLAKDIGGQFTVLRCVVDGAPIAAPSRVIIKQVPVEGHDLHAEGMNPGQRFLNEGVVLRFLEGLPGERKFGPPLIATDLAAGISIFTDLGDHPTAFDLLRGGDRAKAEGALLRSAAYLGKLHAATYQRAGQFSEQRAAHNYRPPMVDATVDIRDYFDMFGTFMGHLGLEISPAFEREIGEFEAGVHDPGPFYVLCHNDIGPHNFLVLEDEPGRPTVLIDLEFGGFGSGLIDAADTRMIHPAMSWGKRTPDRVIPLVELAYRTELAKGIPHAEDDLRFNTALVHACAHWALIKTMGFWNYYLRARIDEGPRLKFDEPAPGFVDWMGAATLARLEMFLRAADEFGQLPATRAGVEAMLGAVRAVIGSRELGLFEAFGG
jgi:hypothetical protein